jgi:hypothetical protein
MIRTFVFCMSLFLVAGAAYAGDSPKDEKLLGGMSIVGNDDAPKSLAIVPWKGSQLGDTLDALKALDAGRQPVDKEVFMRELDYYQIRSGTRASRGPSGKQDR